MRNWLVLLCLLLALSCNTQELPVQTGLENLVEQKFKPLLNLRVGLITNHTAIDRHGVHAADLLNNSSVILQALFSPEHGLRGTNEAGESVQDGRDSRTNALLFSLYGKTRKPTPEMLDSLDALVFDIQDIGTRFYTYISTLYLSMQAAAEADLPFYVLDRPNPISGAIVEGPVLKSEFESFVGIQPIPLRHGMTIGELATLFNGEGWLGDGLEANLTVIEMKHWKREMFFDQTGLPWVKPSPNMTDLQTALLYPGMGLLEGVNLSEGRGTHLPFINIGAPWFPAIKVKAYLEKLQPGIVRIDTTSFYPVQIPSMSMYPTFQDKVCKGLSFTVLEPDLFKSVEFGVHLLAITKQLVPQKLEFKHAWLSKLLGDDQIGRDIENGIAPETVVMNWQNDLDDFMNIRERYLLYR